MKKAQDNVKNYIDKITKDDPILKEIKKEKDRNRYRRIRAELEWQYETMMEAENE
jgi:hypothetical protein